MPNKTIQQIRRKLGEIASQEKKDRNLRYPSDKVPIPVVQPDEVPDEVPDDLTDKMIFDIIKLQDFTLEDIRMTSLDVHLKIKKPELNLSIDEANPAQVEMLKSEIVELANDIGCSLMDIHHVAPMFSLEKIRKKLKIMVDEGKLTKFRPQMPVTVKGCGSFGYRYKVAPAKFLFGQVPDEVPDDLTDEMIFDIIKLEDFTLEDIRMTSLDVHLKMKNPELNLSIDEANPAEVEMLKRDLVELAKDVGCSLMDIHHVARMFSSEKIRKKLKNMVDKGKLMKFRPQMPVTVEGRGSFGYRYKVAPA